MGETPFIGPGEKPPAYRTALLLVDIQNDYFPGGKNALEGSVEAARRAGELLALCRRMELPIIHVQHVSTRPGATYFLPDTDGVRIHESVAPLAGELVLQKHYPNAFRDKQLLVQLGLMHVARLVICGMMTHMCVDATVRAACRSTNSNASSPGTPARRRRSRTEGAPSRRPTCTRRFSPLSTAPTRRCSARTKFWRS